MNPVHHALFVLLLFLLTVPRRVCARAIYVRGIG
jgi:hypothetical protein